MDINDTRMSASFLEPGRVALRSRERWRGERDLVGVPAFATLQEEGGRGPDLNLATLPRQKKVTLLQARQRTLAHSLAASPLP